MLDCSRTVLQEGSDSRSVKISASLLNFDLHPCSLGTGNGGVSGKLYSLSTYISFCKFRGLKLLMNWIPTSFLKTHARWKNFEEVMSPFGTRNCRRIIFHPIVTRPKMSWIRLHGLLLSVLLAWAVAIAPMMAMAQQPYNNTAGFKCNGASETCTTYALYKTFQAGETLDQVGGYFNTSATSISSVSALSFVAPSATLSAGHFLYIPLDCRCQNVTSQMQVLHTIVPGDTFLQLSQTVFGGLTTYDAMVNFNPTIDPRNPTTGDVITVPIFCACPTAVQLADGVNFLLTHLVYPNQTLQLISGYFGLTTAELATANELPSNASVGENTLLLVPLAILPTLVNQSATSTRSRTNLIIGVISVFSTFVTAFFLGLGVLRFLRKRHAREDVESGDKEGLAEIAGIPGFISYKHLSVATKQFSDELKLGEGGFGSVYQGVLPKTGAPVAVKKVSNRSRQGEREFLVEVQIISQLRHRNVVELMGFCRHQGKFLLVYELLPKGSLDRALFKPKRYAKTVQGSHVLSWSQRWKIVSGIAAALNYLHEGWRQQVIHRDVKSSNIMLDDEYNPKLGDFGLARLVNHEYTAPTTNVAGTFGYIAPEATSGRFTVKTDVFAFGAVALEVACGRRALDATVDNSDDWVLVDLVWRRLEEGHLLSVADQLLWNDFDAEQMCIVLKLGLLCSHPNPSSRPSMREVVQVLAGDVDPPDVPHCKPEMAFRPNRSRLSIDDLLISTPQSEDSKSGGGQHVSVACSGSLSTTDVSSR